MTPSGLSGACGTEDGREGRGAYAPGEDARQEDVAALVKRLRAAVGPDRDLDLMCWAVLQGHAFNLQTMTVPVKLCDGPIVNYRVGSGVISVAPATLSVPHYTSSIDAALTLFPEGWIALTMTIRERQTATVTTGHPYEVVPGATAPLALCIAALLARGVSPAAKQPPAITGKDG